MKPAAFIPRTTLHATVTRVEGDIATMRVKAPWTSAGFVEWPLGTAGTKLAALGGLRVGGRLWVIIELKEPEE